MKGLIALDIDGTITDDHSRFPLKTKCYLERLAKEGWMIAFITGRIFSRGFRVIGQFDAPYYYAVHNGAILLKMPQRRVEMKSLLDLSYIEPFSAAANSCKTGCVVCGGYENGDICYLIAKDFSNEQLSFLLRRADVIGESWQLIENFDQLPFTSYPSLKVFGSEEMMSLFIQKAAKKIDAEITANRGSYSRELFIAQATPKGMNKGRAIKELRALLDPQIVIAAGDDYNDIPMLQEADIAIVMETAPEHMKELAAIVAPAVSKEGLVKALEEAVRR